MFSRQSNRKNRPYRVKKTGIKEENIDRQITVIHRAIAKKLLAENALGNQHYVDEILANLALRRDEGRMGYGEFLTWWSIMELINEPDVFLKSMIEESPRMRKLRRRTPFVGVLTEAERQAALEENALGALPSLSSLL